jgi:threonine synthase
VDPTGTAGLAGTLELAERDLIGSNENVVVIFTGVERKLANARQ